MKVYANIVERIGHTPLVELKNIENKYNLKAKLLAKVEGLNPSGSTKERVALQMILDAEEEGKLVKGSTIIEPTSGNTGIGLALIGVSKGYRVIIVMPDSMSEERRNLIKAYGAELVLTEGAKGMKGAIEKAKELADEIENSFIPDQFNNPSNPKAHYLTTGPEIWEDSEGKVDIFVAGVGTGGTITGVGHYLKDKKPNIKVIAVEPMTSPVLSKGISGSHQIQGIGAGFIPSILDTKIYEEVIPVQNEDAFLVGREMIKLEGISCGISSGAAVKAAIEVASRKYNEGKTIVVLLPDNGDRYLSTALFKD